MSFIVVSVKFCGLRRDAHRGGWALHRRLTLDPDAVGLFQPARRANEHDGEEDWTER
jgi:hypothetical protein